MYLNPANATLWCDRVILPCISLSITILQPVHEFVHYAVAITRCTCTPYMVYFITQTCAPCIVEYHVHVHVCAYDIMCFSVLSCTVQFTSSSDQECARHSTWQVFPFNWSHCHWSQHYVGACNWRAKRSTRLSSVCLSRVCPDRDEWVIFLLNKHTCN